RCRADLDLLPHGYRGWVITGRGIGNPAGRRHHQHGRSGAWGLDGRANRPRAHGRTPGLDGRDWRARLLLGTSRGMRLADTLAAHRACLVRDDGPRPPGRNQFSRYRAVSNDAARRDYGLVAVLYFALSDHRAGHDRGARGTARRSLKRGRMAIATDD